MIPQAQEWQAMNKDPNRETHRDLFILDKTTRLVGSSIKIKTFFTRMPICITSEMFSSRVIDSKVYYPSSFYTHFNKRQASMFQEWDFPFLWKPDASSVYITVVTFAVHPKAYHWPLQLWLTETSAVLIPLVWDRASTPRPNMQVKAASAKQ